MQAAAQEAGLRYVSDAKPGITREKVGAGWQYRKPDGTVVADAHTLKRIESLVLPPAYTDVWICTQANGHLQATGRDAKGRKQYRYHPLWSAHRNENKFGRMLAFGQALPALRVSIAADLAKKGMPKEKVLAMIVRLMDTKYIRVGNEEYAKTSQHFGLTTLSNEHLTLEHDGTYLQFVGKSGKAHHIKLDDKRLVKLVKQVRDLPGQDLFQFVDSGGNTHAIHSDMVNAYVKEKSGADFTAKDFRTWAGTKCALGFCLGIGPALDDASLKKNLVDAVKHVAGALGNTVAVSRKYYIHPHIFAAYGDKRLFALTQESEHKIEDGYMPEERMVLALLTAESSSI